MHHLNLYFTKYAYEMLRMIVSIFKEESLFAPLFTSSPFCEWKGHFQVQDSSQFFQNVAQSYCVMDIFIYYAFINR
jgi:hypothetical protein